MPAKSFLRLVNGIASTVFGAQTSAGAGSAGEIVALDDSGRIDGSMMPVGIGADTAAIVTSEALSAGDFVNIWESSGAKVRKADATVQGKDAVGFVMAAFATGVPATVYFKGTNTQVSGQVGGTVYLQTTAGKAGATIPSAAGNIVMSVGVALSATSISFEPGTPYMLA